MLAPSMRGSSGSSVGSPCIQYTATLYIHFHFAIAFNNCILSVSGQTVDGHEQQFQVRAQHDTLACPHTACMHPCTYTHMHRRIRARMHKHTHAHTHAHAYMTTCALKRICHPSSVLPYLAPLLLLLTGISFPPGEPPWSLPADS